MTAETELRNLWACSAALQRLLPLSRLTSGTTVCDSYPFGVIRQDEGTVSLLTNHGFKQKNTPLELTIKSDTRAVLDSILSTFEAVLPIAEAFRLKTRQICCLQNGIWALIVTLDWRE